MKWNWEYTAYSTDDPQAALLQLDLLGNENWELVSVVERNGYTWFWFKRQKLA